MTNEPVIIDGLTCAETLTRYGCERQANWCRNADGNLKRLAANYSRLRAEADALYERHQKYEPTPKPYESLVRWTGD